MEVTRSNRGSHLQMCKITTLFELYYVNNTSLCFHIDLSFLVFIFPWQILSFFGPYLINSGLEPLHFNNRFHGIPFMKIRENTSVTIIYIVNF